MPRFGVTRGSVSSVLAFILVLLLILPLSASPAPTAPGSLFVTPGGSGDSCTQLQPCALATALSLAIDDWTIYLAGGTYTGSGDQVVMLTKSVMLRGGWDGATSGEVTTNPPIHASTLDGENTRRCLVVNGGSPTIQGLTITRGAGETGAGIYALSGNPTVRGNVITANAADWYGGGIGAETGEWEISGNHITHNTAGYGGGGLLLGTLATAQVEGNEISFNQADYGGALYLSEPQVSLVGNTMLHNESDSTIRTSGDTVQLSAVNNVVADSSNYGFKFTGGQVELLHNTIVGQLWGILVDYGTELTLTNNIVAFHTRAGIVVGTSGPPVVTADHNLFWGNGSDAFVGENPVLGPPSFVNREADDYHLGLGSAAVDAAVYAGVDSDIDGDARPAGAGFDIGADEWQAPAVYLYVPLVARSSQ